jgi:hypothetical protein
VDTRHATGIEVFRDCQVKALDEQSKTRAATKIKSAQAESGQSELFQSLHEMAPDNFVALRREQHADAERSLLELTPAVPRSARDGHLWPLILSRNVVRLKEVNEIANRFAGRKAPFP